MAVTYPARLSRDPKRSSKVVICLALALWLAGCAAKNPPPPTKRIVQVPEYPWEVEGEGRINDLNLVARAIPPVGGVLPVQIAVTNATRRSLDLDAQGIRALTVSGTSVASLSSDQAIEAARDAGKLAEALSRVELVHEPTANDYKPSRVEKALRICAWGLSPRDNYMMLPWLVLVCAPVVTGALAKSAAVASSSSLQISEVELSSGRLTPYDERNGYIFLPVGHYKALEIPIKDRNTGGLEIIVLPWNSAADRANTTVPKPPSTTNSENKQLSR